MSERTTGPLPFRRCPFCDHRLPGHALTCKAIAPSRASDNINVGAVAGKIMDLALRPKSSAERKAEPIHSGVMLYFPDALAAVARISVAGNNKHNPGEPLHWARGKSMDQMDALARHSLTLEAIDPETGEQEAAALAWRALAQLQLLEEKRLAKLGIIPYSGVVA